MLFFYCMTLEKLLFSIRPLHDSNMPPCHLMKPAPGQRQHLPVWTFSKPSQCKFQTSHTGQSPSPWNHHPSPQATLPRLRKKQDQTTLPRNAFVSRDSHHASDFCWSWSEMITSHSKFLGAALHYTSLLAHVFSLRIMEKREPEKVSWSSNGQCLQIGLHP